MEDNAFVFEIVQQFNSKNLFFVQVNFDGGHDEDFQFAGIGCEIRVACEPPIDSSDWKLWARGFGRIHGCTSTEADVGAFAAASRTVTEFFDR